jgi:hypothetical protein
VQSVTQLAVRLDITMLQARGIAIADEDVPDANLPFCNPADQLGDRLLIKYLRPDEAEKYSILSGVSMFSGRHFVTPTPIAARDLVSVLALPPLGKRPCWLLLLRPEKLLAVKGPRRIQGGYGVEYVLEDGFSTLAIAEPGWVREHR